MLTRRIHKAFTQLRPPYAALRHIHSQPGSPNSDPKDDARDSTAERDAEKLPTEEEVEANRSAAANFAQNSFIGGAKYTAVPREKGSEPSKEKKQHVRRGQSHGMVAPVTLQHLVGLPTMPIEKNLPQLMKVPGNAYRLDDTFPYPVHPSTVSQLRATVSTMLHPTLHAAHVERLPYLREGIVLLTCPFKGSEIYLRTLATSVAAENNALFVSVTNDDLFERLSGHKVVTGPPLKTDQHGGMYGGGGGQRPMGRRRAPSMLAVQLVPTLGGGGNISAQPQEEDADLNEDVPSVPYPWFKGYQNSKGERLVLARNRSGVTEPLGDAQKLIGDAFTQFFDKIAAESTGRPVIVYYEDLLALLTSEEGKLPDLIASLSKSLEKCRDEGTNILLLAPHTSTFQKTSSQSNRMGGIGNLIKALNSGEEDGPPDEEPGGPGGFNIMGGQRRRPKGLSYDTPLDKYLGVTAVNVFPPPGGELKRLQSQLEDDLRILYWNANQWELALVAGAADVELPLADERLSKLITAPPRPSNASLALLSDRLLSPLEVETLVFLSIDAYRQRKPDGRRKLENNAVLSITPDDFINACSIGSLERITREDMKNGTAYAGVFKNPGDRTRLSQREEQLLGQCLVKPDPAVASFQGVGGLKKTKQTIQELIRLPLQRPELFETGILRQSTTGILLFGPPGTGKTLLARAVAAESGANFLNVQMSDIQSMWVGENEKNVKSLFTLARKLRPCVIFVDEIDALLRARQRHQAHHVTNTINEFMQEWDGLQSDSNGVIVVGATNRPFDLDEAVLRRLPRRILVDMPDYEARCEILGIKLKDDPLGENTPAERKRIIEEVASLTNGWSGSDLRNFCIAAAYASLRPHVESGSDLTVRPSITLEDFKTVLESGDVRPSLSDRAELSKQLKDWDKVYGTGSGGYGRGGSEWGFDLVLQQPTRTSSDSKQLE
ncbi:hypothetical protein SpCBS45565_g08224 [Spizellomyces sp. 'palustris']|nr:hypothetical protein SpCBS45565_g08224 [Spizellomyces sp. 'palustris']